MTIDLQSPLTAFPAHGFIQILFTEPYSFSYARSLHAPSPRGCPAVILVCQPSTLRLLLYNMLTDVISAVL